MAKYHKIHWTVYLIVDEVGQGYVGSTINLHRRLIEHRTQRERFTTGLKGKLHTLILETGILDNLTARKRENEWINKLPTVNKNQAYFDRKEFQQSERGKALQAIYDKRYYPKRKLRQQQQHC